MAKGQIYPSVEREHRSFWKTWTKSGDTRSISLAQSPGHDDQLLRFAPEFPVIPDACQMGVTGYHKPFGSIWAGAWPVHRPAENLAGKGGGPADAYESRRP